MRDKTTNDIFSGPGLVNTLFYQYRVEKMDSGQKHLFSDLFDQYRVFRREISRGLSMNPWIGNRLLIAEPVIFIVLTNYPESVPVGFIQLYSIQSSVNTVKTTIVTDLFVQPPFRNQGIALKLIEAAIKFAIHNQSASIQLDTIQDNPIVQKLYESVGFKKEYSKSGLNLYSIQFATG